MKPSQRILEITNAHKVLDNKEIDKGPTTYWDMAIIKFLDEFMDANPCMKMPERFAGIKL